jgi:aminopeptidase N
VDGTVARIDPHSYANDAQPRTQAFEWRATFDFDIAVLRAEISLVFVERAAGGSLDLDTRGLTIDAVLGPDSAPLAYTLHPADPILGSRLEVAVPRGAASIRIVYRTSPTASALQWLSAEQTLGKEHPYLFSQCQAIHARSVLPCQDTPSFRQTFTATLDVPAALRAVMGAAALGREVRGDRAIERFEMRQPIPPYLFAFAVGDLASRDLSARSRVWAEPGLLEAAAWEFEHIDDLLRAAESLFGPYEWERADLLVMPPSFPYGGMENPRLTFLTPSLLAGDRSQVNIVGHELAHAWTGNLVTNTNAEHFWLNEGFTVFAERRIVEALDGPDVGALHAAIGHERLLSAIAQHAEHPELTKLRTHLEGVDPDQAYSQVPYEKGYLFLKTLEQAAGREAFDGLLATWLRAHRFGAATTEDFLSLVERTMPGLLAKVDAMRWIDEPGLPPQHWTPASERLAAVRRVTGRAPTAEEARPWSPTEWHLYLEAMPKPSPKEVCEELETKYALTTTKNPEVLVAWLVLACESGYAPVLPRVEQLLSQTGRMKYVKPLYRALAGRAATRPLALDLFARFGAQYHPIARQVVRDVLSIV